MSTDLPTRTIGTTGPTGKIHVFDDGLSTCSTPRRQVRQLRAAADVPLDQSTRAPDRHGQRASVTAHVAEHNRGPYVELLGSDDLAVSPASPNKVGISAVRVHRA